MSFKKFEKKDILRNVIETHPKVRFDIYDSKLYYNNRTPISGAFAENVRNVPSGFISLYEMNIDRVSGSNNLIYPFVEKDSNLIKFKAATTTSFNEAEYGAILTGSYPLSASITRSKITGSSNRQYSALKNTLQHYAVLSSDYTMIADYLFATASLISIPSIFYGSSIEKGTVDLKFYISGTLTARVQDINKNGRLIQTEGLGASLGTSSAGVVLYNEGFLILTGSWTLGSGHTENYDSIPSASPAWIYFGCGANDGTATGTIPSSSYSLEFNGTNYVPSWTFMAHAGIGEFNHSNNPTYIQHGQTNQTLSGAYVYEQPTNTKIQNVVSSSYLDPTGSFEKTTYISKVAIYDKDKNLIGIATTSSPIKKTQNRNITFKLKMDV